MRNVILDVVLVLMMVSMFVSCNQNHQKELETAYTLAESAPDSALVYLNHIDQDELSEEEMAKYSLVYYMAQDKSGLDVDNDSLIRIAYDWYDAHQEDSLYALCLNYMGKYYILNDSVEQAKAFLERTYDLAKKKDDIYLMSLSLDKLVRIENDLNPRRALKLARKLVEFYDKHPRLRLTNKVYARLRLSTSLVYADSLSSALDENLKALDDAKKMNATDVMSDAYLDLSSIYGELGLKDSSLYYAKMACLYSKADTVTSQLALAFAFYDVDSLKEMFAVLNRLDPKLMEDKNAILYLKTLGAIKSTDVVFAANCVDSSKKYSEETYREAVKGKYNYYISYVKKVKEKAELKGKAKMQGWIFLLSVLLLLSLLCFVVYTYFVNKKQANLRIHQQKELAATLLAKDQQLHEKEMLIANKLHKEELAHKEVQLATIRKYLQKKIAIIEQLNSIGDSGSKHFFLSEEDWTEVEVFLEGVEDLFVTRLKKRHPNLTQSDVRLMMLLRLKLSQKSLALIYCISEKAIKQKLFLYKERVGIKNEPISLRKYIETF